MKAMNRNDLLSRIALAATVFFASATATPAASLVMPQDVVTVGTVTGSGVVIVPVSIRDVSGTPLGVDQPPGSRIQSFSIKVNYSNPANVSAITFTRAGITASLTPAFESMPTSSGSISLLDTFVESTNLIPFVLNAAPPGNVVANLTVTIPPSVPPGTVITLTLDPTLTQLTDDGGSAATVETVGNARLVLVNGAITVAAPPATQIPTLGSWGLGLLALALASIGVRFVR